MAKAQIRCAVYTRKSTEEGLEQAFNSLDAQREACVSYIASQRHEGWTLVKTGYDDGGFSGGNMERPGLKRLLEGVRTGIVDVIVVYKVDRLTRSLADFAKIVDVLDARGASFVSVTQSFNTTTSMGRLTLNVLLSFAQFEREVTGERIRDKIAASKAKGMWMGGPVPLGYRVEDRKLVIDEDDAIVVRHIFERYLALGNGTTLLEELRAEGYRTKLRQLANGTVRGGVPFGRGMVFALLANPIYIGQIAHKGTLFEGEHPPLIQRGIWDKVQQLINGNRVERASGTNIREPSLLAGIIRDGHGRKMSPSHAVKGNKRYRYYITHASALREGEPEALRIPAHDIEAAVAHQLGELLRDKLRIRNIVATVDGSAAMLASTIALANGKATKLEVPHHRRAIIGALVKRVVVDEHQLAISIDTQMLLRMLGISEAADQPDLVLTAPSVRMRIGKAVKLMLGDAGSLSQDAALIELLREARDAQRLALASPDKSIRALAAEQGKCSTRMGKLLRLGWLAPSIVEAIVSGEHPGRLTARSLLETDLPVCWDAQRKLLVMP